MDGTVDRLVQLEEEKRRTLIALDVEGYERAVSAQSELIPALQTPQGEDVAKLKAFTRLADLNAQLFENLLTTTTTAVNGLLYTDDGRTENSARPVHTFSAKA